MPEPEPAWEQAGPECAPEGDAAGPPDGPTAAEDPASAPWQTLTAISGTAPGADLAIVLELVDHASLDDLMLVETVAAWERLAVWAHLGAALCAAELSRRAAMNPMWDAPVPTNGCVAGDELAMRLAWSRPAANRLVRDGRALENELLLVADAVRAGLVDTPKLRVLTDRLHDRPGELAWAVQEQVLPAAGTRTPSQLAADVDRALLQVDPEDAADRLARATASRRVCHPKTLPDGMAGIWAVLPAADAVRADATLEATARAARALGDLRTLDQLRADAFTDLACGNALLAGAALGAATLTASESRSSRALAEGGISVADAGVAADDDRSGDDDETIDDDVTAAPVDSSEQTAQLPARAPSIRIPRVRIDVTVSLSTLMGLDEAPGELAGFGPISAEQARALAAGGVWRRLVTDPLSGAVLDVGRTRYRPPRPLAEHVMARDGTCAAPSCSVPAHRCDLDHTVEYHGLPANGSPGPGATSADNLGPLSNRCHRLKTDGGFTLRQVAAGVFEWRTPAGLAYRVTPGDHGRTERLTARSTPNPGYPDEPPF